MKRGGIIHTSFGGGNFKYILLLDEYSDNEHSLSYLYRCKEDGTLDITSDNPVIGVGTSREDRMATPQEKQILLESLSKNMEELQQIWMKAGNTTSLIFKIMLEKVLE